MSKIKIVIILILCFGLYKGYVAFTEFEIGVSDRVAELEKKADFERQGDVIALMMYLGDNKNICLFLIQVYRNERNC